jgi:hypothetical protein
MLNELELMDGLVCCNIWHSDDIICVDPASGKSVREYGKHIWEPSHLQLDCILNIRACCSLLAIKDMSSLWPKNERGSSENVLNGIALGTDHVLITGKRWDRMYKISFADWPSLYRSTDKENTVAESSNVIQSQDEDSAIVEGTEEGVENVDVEMDDGEVAGGNNEEGSDVVESTEEQLTVSTSYTVVEQVTHDPTSFT